MELGLTGKRVLITGASRGLGAAMASHFLQEKAQLRIVARGSEQLHKTESELQQQYGVENIKALKCDCTDANALTNLRQSIQDDWQGIDIVVANIGDGRSIPDALPDSEQW
ncbi:MAG: SDR family NAD(P)-dependent oxidoreductase, partial [Gammaproteobacteria bacterium]|nr:SDR family NAD(P)-dependent oxidoreductase [Gammaproteobacteria bacterium]